MGYSDEFYRRRKKLREERQPGESEYKGETGVRLPLPSYAPHDYNEDRFPNLPEYHPAKYTPLVENPYMRPEPPKPAITPTQLGSRVGQAAFDKFKAMYSAPREDFSLGKLGTGILEEGLHAAAKPFSATMAALEGLITKPIDYLETGTTEGPVTDSGLFHRWDQAISEDLEQARKKNAANLEAGGTGAKIANTVGVGTIAALPQLVAALGTGGASKAIDAGANMPGITGTIRNAIKGTKENPMFWTSYFQTVGEEYQEALNDGASELEAALRALGSGAANAAVEVGGGIESLPNELQGDKYTIKKWVEDMIDEGREEVAQGIISRATQNLFYGKDNPLYSVSDPDAVVNPMTAAQEFAGGAAVGGILAGAGGLGSNIVNRGRFQKPAGIGNYTPSETERFNITAPTEIVDAISDAERSSGDSMYQDPTTGEWMYGKPPAPHRPSEVEDANAFQEERPRVRIPGNIPMENIVKDVSDNSQKAVDHIELLNQGKRVPDKDFRPDELDQLGDVGIDANFNVFNPNPDEHISQRDPADLGNRKVNAFQYDNPAVHDFFKGAAEQLVKDAEISASEPAGRRKVKGPQGVQYVNEILESASIRDAMDMGLSRSQIVKAAQDLIADKGQENNAAAKRLELVLDKMLSNGYKTIEGDVVGPNQAYIDTKKQIPGYVEREPLPLGTDNIVGTTEPPLNLREDTGKPVVDAFTAQLGKAGQSVVGDMYSQRGQLNESEANSWTRAMGAYYSAGQAGVDIGLVPSLNREYSSFVTPAEAQAAYLAGQADAVKEAPATAEDSSVVEERPAPIRVFRGTNRSTDPTERNLASVQTLDEVLGRPGKGPNLVPLSYYTDSEEDAGHYADHDKDVFEGYFLKQAQRDFNQAVMDGKIPEDTDEAQWVMDHAKESYRILTGRSDVPDGFVSQYDITPGKILDLSGLGENATVDDIYSALSDLTGVSVSEIDDLLSLGDIAESGDEIPVFRVLRNVGDADGGQAGTRFVKFMEDNGFDSVKYQESGANHYAVLPGVNVSEVARPNVKPSEPAAEKKGLLPEPPAQPEKPKSTAPKTEPVKEEPSKEKHPKAEPKEGNPQQSIADGVKKYIAKGQSFTADRLFELANKAYGGTMAEGAYTVKDAYDGMELAVNQYLLETAKDANGDVKTAKEFLKKMQDLLSKLPTQTKRTEEMEQFQQFSTPPNISYVAAWAAHVNPSDVVLEPSAGIGGLAVWPKAWGATVYGNEFSTRRLEFLDQLGLDGTFNLNAEQIDNLLPDHIKPTLVIMNPPFSSTAGRMKSNKTSYATRHIEQALERLEPGGRLVAILGRGMSEDAASFKGWWKDIKQEYNVRANVRIDGSNYKKYGTTFDDQLVVIDKNGPTTGETITGEYKDLADVIDTLEVVRNERKGIVRDSDPVPERAGKPEPRRGAEERDPSGTVSDTVRQERPESESGRRPSDGKARKRSDDSRGDRRADDRRDGSAGAGVEQQDAGPRMALSGRSDAGVERRAPVKKRDVNSTYADYVPKKVHIKGAKPHPAVLVESAAMAAVDPPDPTYTPHLPQSLIETGYPSAAQLENVVYAGQAHEQILPDGQRRGFFIGDGTGVGKGVQIASIILDNYNQGRKKAIWISEKIGLLSDAKRDWAAVGGDPDQVFSLQAPKLIKNGIHTDEGIGFIPYTTLSAPKNKEARFKMLKDWLGDDFDGVIAMDEAHNMGNSVPVKKGRGKSKPADQALTGIELQRAFPNARVVYASATGATDIYQYGYLERLGLWGKGTAFHDLNDFINKISEGGLAAMELVARDMKAMGVYMSRSISYDDVKYDTIQHELTPIQTEIYDTMSDAWQEVLQNVDAALEVTGASKNGMARSAAYGVIYRTQQQFYNQILTSMSMPTVVEDIKKELANGRSVVIQLTNTNEAQADRAIAKAEANGGGLDDVDLTPSEMLKDLVLKSFPTQLYETYEDDNGNIKSRPVTDSMGNPVEDKKAVRMRDALVEKLGKMRVPDGPLEILLDTFGVDQVAEITGRTRRIVEKMDESGHMRRVMETGRKDPAREADTKAFQDGKKRILVFSAAGGTGKSYHADRRAKNQQQRVHYLLQAGWNAAKAVQGFGRTHRSNQASAPIFRLVTTNAMGQKRFTSTIARRLDQLGALTKGQRQASGGVFSEKDNLENPIAQDALSIYYKQIDPSILKKLGLYDKIYDKRTGKINEGSDALRDVSKFLNRILSLRLDEQNEVFEGFYNLFEAMLDTAIANGTVDMGLENYAADRVEVADEKAISKDPKSGVETKYVQMKAYNKPTIIQYGDLEELHPNFTGFVKTEDGAVRAVYELPSKTNAKGEVQRIFKLQTPVKGKFSTYTEKTLEAKTTPVPKKEWKKSWDMEVKNAPEYVEKTLHMLTGTLLPIWNKLPSDNTRVMRVLAADGRQYLGRIIAPSQIDTVLRNLGTGRKQVSYTPSQVQDGVMKNGQEAVLRNDRMKIIRRKVSGEWRMEVTGVNLWYLPRHVKGVFSEKISGQERYFIPTGKAGEPVLKNLLEYNPVQDMRDVQDEDVQYMRVREDSKKDSNSRWTTERVGDESVEVKPISDIIAKIQHDFGINITKGHIRGRKGTLGLYNRKNEGVRIKGANDLPTVAHELGHHLDNLYGMTKHLTNEAREELHSALGEAGRKDKWASEGLAEYVRAFLTNRQKAALDYPVFTEMFLNAMNPTDRALVEQLADDMNAALSLDKTAESSIRSMEDADADFRTRKEKTWDWLDERYQKHVDALHAIKRFDDSVGSNVYTKASNSAYADAMAWNIVTGDLTDAHGQYVGPGLKTVLTGLDLKNRKQMKAFNEYLVVRHAPERMKEGMQIFADPTKDTPEFCTRRQAELEAEHPEFAEIADRLYEFQKMFLRTWGVKMGLVSPGSAKKWAERWEHYVPFNRRFKKLQLNGSKRGFANQTSTIHKARGAGYDINDPLDNIINNMVKMVTAATRNDVMRELTTSADKLGASATFLEKVPTPMAQHKISTKKIVDDLISGVAESELSTEDKQSVDDLITASIDEYLVQYTKKGPSGDVVTVLKDGKPEYWKINDRPLLESLTNMTPKTLGAVLGVYANVSRFMTSNITGNNVVWSIFSNAPRDLMTLFTYSKDRNAAKIFGGIAETYINKMKGGNADPLFKEYLAMGGGKSSAWSADRGLTKKVRKELTKKISLNPLDWISFVSDAVEMGPRYATYKIMRQNGATPEEAFYESTDVTVNFRRAGTVGRELNAYIPFYNAGLQGLDKFRRWITAADLQGVDRRKAVRGRMIGYVTASAALAAIAYIANNLDDEDEKEYQRLSTFIKNSFWVAPLGGGKYFAIPKPRELAVLSSFIESALEAYIGGNSHAFDDFYGYAVDNMTPKLLSSLLQGDVNEAVGGLGLVGTAHYIVANKDFLGRPIVSPALDRLLPRDQYTRRTSQIAKAVGQAFNISPVKLDFFMEQVLGGWWKYQRALFPVGEEYRDPTLGVHGSYIKDNLYSNDITRWLYDYADACGKESKSNPGSMEQAIRCKDAENMASFYSTFNKLAKDKKETEKLRSTRSTALTMIEDFRTAEEKNTSTPAVRAVRELCKDKGDTEYLPSVMPAVVKDGEEKEHILSAPEYLEYQTEYWGFYWDNVEENLSSGQSVTEKAAVCKAAKTVARERATERALSRKGLKSKGFFEKYPGIDDDDLTSFFSQRTVAREDGKLKQDEVIDIIDDMDLTRERAYTLFRSMYQSDKNNPWA